MTDGRDDRSGAIARRLGTTDAVLAEHVCLTLVAAVWLLVVTPSSGGLHDARTALLSASLVPALLVVRPWQRAPRWLLVAVVAAALGALLVLVVNPPGWDQADSPGSQLTGLLVLPVVLAYARTPARRRAVAWIVVAAALLQVWPAWLAWWGGRDPNRLVVGTFYWHNQLGTWLAACGAVAGGLAVRTTGRGRAVALTTATVAGTGVVLSTSRASLILWLLALGGALVLAVGARPRLPALASAAVVPALVVGLVLLLTSSLFFPDHEWAGVPMLQRTPSAGAGPQTGADPSGRGASTLAGNGDDRLDWTEAALAGWLGSPLLGHGFGSFERTAEPRLRDDTARSPWVHNGPAEALTSGGLVFGGPVVLISLWLAVGALRALLRRRRHRGEDDGVRAAAALGTLVLLAHTLVDFDWHYSSLVVLLGVTGALVHADDAPAREVTTEDRMLAAGLVGVAAFATVATLVERLG